MENKKRDWPTKNSLSLITFPEKMICDFFFLSPKPAFSYFFSSHRRTKRIEPRGETIAAVQIQAHYIPPLLSPQKTQDTSKWTLVIFPLLSLFFHFLIILATVKDLLQLRSLIRQKLPCTGIYLLVNIFLFY